MVRAFARRRRFRRAQGPYPSRLDVATLTVPTLAAPTTEDSGAVGERQTDHHPIERGPMTATEASTTKLLVPTDYSERSMRGVERAASLASALDAELLLLVNLNLPEQSHLEETSSIRPFQLDEAAMNELHAVAERHAPGVPHTAMVTHLESPAKAILAVADAEGVEMIVIASHGRSGLQRWVLGSVAERVARTSPVPVLIVPAHDG